MVTTILRGSVLVENEKFVGSKTGGQFVPRTLAPEIVGRPAGPRRDRSQPPPRRRPSQMLEPLPKRSSTVREVHQRLRSAIVSGALAPEARLYEQRIAAELGVSRTPVREALAMLDAEELVVAGRNRRDDRSPGERGRGA